jgi:DNA polymerase-3 subunit epsilon
MREIVLDTETTGLDPEMGDRIVEIGALELINHVPTGQTFHCYINPERPMPAEAYAVHGLGDDFLKNKPVFAAVVDEFLAFIDRSPLVIHNASFDLKFLNAELKRLGRLPLPSSRAVDTLAIVRSRFPGSPASLDAMCRRFGIDNSARLKHGALLDSEILAEVYLELIGGRQPDLGLNAGGPGASTPSQPGHRQPLPRRERPLTPRRTAAEAEAHADFVAGMGEAALWLRFS